MDYSSLPKTLVLLIHFLWQTKIKSPNAVLTFAPKLDTYNTQFEADNSVTFRV